MDHRQQEFNSTIGELDRVLSVLVGHGRACKARKLLDTTGGVVTPQMSLMDEANQQTLKHHAEDMIAAGEKILKDLGKDVQGTPQPGGCDFVQEAK